MCKGKMITGHCWGIVIAGEAVTLYSMRKSARNHVRINKRLGVKCRIAKLLFCEVPRPSTNTRGGV